MGVTVGKLMVEIGADTSGAVQGMQQVSAEMKGMQTSEAAIGESLGGLSSLATAAGLMGVAGTVGEVVSQFMALGQAGAQLERTQTASRNLARSMGSDMDSILTSLRTASMGTVSNADLMSASSRAMMLGVSADAEQLGNLMEIAALRGRAMGKNATDAFSDMVTGIGRMSPMILDNLGIVVDADATYSAYAASIGKAADQLTSAEKRQALLNRVLQEGNDMLAETGGLAEDSATKFERLSASWENLTGKLKEAAAEPASNVVAGLNAVLFGTTQSLSDVLAVHETQIQQTAGSYADYRAEIERATAAAGMQLDAEGNLVRYGQTSGGVRRAMVKENYLLTESEWEQMQAVEAATVAAEKMGDTRREAIDDAQDWIGSEKEIAAVQKRLADDQKKAADDFQKQQERLWKTMAAGEIENTRLGESLKWASDQQIASTVIGKLDEQLQNHQITQEQYNQAVVNLQKNNYLATDASIALAGAIPQYMSALSAGIIPTERAADALKQLRTDAADGTVDFTKFLEKLGVGQTALDQWTGVTRPAEKGKDTAHGVQEGTGTGDAQLGRMPLATEQVKQDLAQIPQQAQAAADGIVKAFSGNWEGVGVTMGQQLTAGFQSEIDALLADAQAARNALEKILGGGGGGTGNGGEPPEGFASGGNFPANKTILVGENGPELVRFNQAGRVYNTSETQQVLAGNSRTLVIKNYGTIVNGDARRQRGRRESGLNALLAAME